MSPPCIETLPPSGPLVVRMRGPARSRSSLHGAVNPALWVPPESSDFWWGGYGEIENGIDNRLSAQEWSVGTRAGPQAPISPRFHSVL